MTVSMIAAIGKNYELGKNNDLIWHFKEDMNFFKQTTLGSAVIMGRKTFESLPKALPGRQNIVISSNKDYVAEGAQVVSSPQEALECAEGKKVFIIGGARVYGHFLPSADGIFLTEIDDECPDADAYFPRFDKSLYTSQVLAEHLAGETKFKHVLYKRK